MRLTINNLYNMDCLEGMKLLEDSTVDLIVTSPPYNIGIDYDTYCDKLNWEDYLKWCNDWLCECFRVLKDDGRICLNHYIAFAPREGDNCVPRFPLFDLRNIMEQIGFNVHKIAIWDDITRVKFTAWGSWLSASAPNMQTPYEGVLIAYKKHWKKDNEGVSTITKEKFLEGVSGIWHLGTTTGLTKACFPESLPDMCINLFSYVGDTVMDPFSGSGTTCCVAKALGRNFIGFEISPNYHNVAIERLCNTPYPNEDDFNNFEKSRLFEENF